MLYSFFLNLQKMLGVALPFGFATPTFIIEPDFPTLRIGKRMIAPRDKFLAWLDQQMSA
jgi:hypothetical protein